jgi:tetrahydromethanopterin S-methyltransferase subunit E
VFLSGESLKKLELKDESSNRLIFLGYWVGLLFSIDSKSIISFYSCVSGYLILIIALIIEKKAIEYTDDIENTYKIIDSNADGDIHEENKIL